jgi:hypothetical protein
MLCDTRNVKRYKRFESGEYGEKERERERDGQTESAEEDNRVKEVGGTEMKREMRNLS